MSNHPAPTTIEPEDYRQIVRLKLVLLAVIGFTVFLNGLLGVFASQEEPVARYLTSLQQGVSWPALLAGDRVIYLSVLLNHAISGVSPWSYHAVNIAIHILAALTLFGIACRTLLRTFTDPRAQEAAPWLAFFIALLWMVHPLQTQSVTYLSGRAGALAGLLVLLTLYCAIRAAEAEEHRWLWNGLAVLACAVGMGSAPVAFAAPLLVVLYDVAFLVAPLDAVGRRELRARRLPLYIGLLICYALLLPLLAPRPAEPVLPGVTATSDALTQPGVVLHYLQLALWPSPLVFDYYDWPLADVAGVVVPGLVLLVLLGITVLAWFRWPKLGFLGAWFFLTLVCSSASLPQSALADEGRLYLPLAALAALVVLGVFGLLTLVEKRLLGASAVSDRQYAGKPAPARPAWAMLGAFGLGLVVAGALGFVTFSRNQTYYSAQDLWADTVAKRPNNARAHFQLGNAAVLAGAPEAAAAEYQATTALPADARNEPYRALAVKNLPAAAVLITRAGFQLWSKGDAAGAVPLFRKASELQPEEARYHFDLALALQDSKDETAADKEWQEGLRLDKEWPEKARELAWKGATDPDPKKRDPSGAIFLARQAVQLTGERQPEMLDTLAAAYAAARKFDDAVKTEEKAEKLAKSGDNPALTKGIQERLALYRVGQPYSASQAAP